MAHRRCEAPHPLWILRSWRQALCVQDEDCAYLRSWAQAQGPSWPPAAAVPSRAGWAAAGALKPQHVARGCSPAWLPGVDCDAFAMRDWFLAATGCSAAAGGGVPELCLRGLRCTKQCRPHLALFAVGWPLRRRWLRPPSACLVVARTASSACCVLLLLVATFGKDQ